MKNKLLFVIALLFICFSGRCQERIILKGRVISDKEGVQDVFVINKNTGEETKTNKGGDFLITAKPGDVLVVYNTNINVREFILFRESFNENPYVVSVNYKAYQLDEVIVEQYGRVDEVSLGLVSANQKRDTLTIAERRLNAAGFNSISLIGLINMLSGRMKMLKNNLATERKEMLLEEIKDLYNSEKIATQFNIPKENAGAFIYYLAEKKEMTDIIKQGNKTYIDFLMIDYAKEYLERLNNE